MKYFSILILLFTFQIDGAAQDTTKTKSAEPIHDFADVPPSFKGGDEAMAKFIRKNVVYPELARENGEQGTVYVQFVVEKNGKITNVKVIKGATQLLDNEAIRVISKMPKWKPGTRNGQPVRMYYTVPIKFTIS